ncbi:hypothetical protein MAR_036463 [Mya arenaria]|uniref:Uncharacterized protein n=1 Tax=Mya arenaria TaxID=6604 RepID=A0ABY7FNT4_MYAAR|nr:hypothetical protein MAR_036463 [Mya arenaria]
MDVFNIFFIISKRGLFLPRGNKYRDLECLRRLHINPVAAALVGRMWLLKSVTSAACVHEPLPGSVVTFLAGVCDTERLLLLIRSFIEEKSSPSITDKRMWISLASFTDSFSPLREAIRRFSSEQSKKGKSSSTSDDAYSRRLLAMNIPDEDETNFIWSSKNIAITWHPQLSDKAAKVHNHLYFAIDNCRNNPDELRAIIDNCIPHFQNIHESGPAESQCKTPNFVPDYILLCTYNLKKHVKSFNNSVLIYLDKRIHYNNSSYKTRIDLATFSLNEHIDGPYTPRLHDKPACWEPETSKTAKGKLGSEQDNIFWCKELFNVDFHGTPQTMLLEVTDPSVVDQTLAFPSYLLSLRLYFLLLLFHNSIFLFVHMSYIPNIIPTVNT